MGLNEKKWKFFRIGDLFEKQTLKGYPKCEEDLTECSDGYHIYGQNIRYQYPQKVLLSEEYLHVINPRHPIIAYTSSVGEIGMIDESFYRSGDNGAFQGLFPKNSRLGRHAIQFILTVLELKFQNYGYTTSLANVIDAEIPLPVDRNGAPDWRWITCYMKSQERGLDDQINTIIDIAAGDRGVIKAFSEKLDVKEFSSWIKENCNMSFDGSIVFDTDRWKEFHIYSLFNIFNGKGITMEEIEKHPGNLNAVQSGELNNGVIGKIDRDYCCQMEYTLCDRPCLTVARSGSSGFVSFQKDGCVVGDSAKILLLKEGGMSDYVYLFLKTLLLANRFKYGYGRKVTEHKYMEDTVKLPVTSDNNPDWAWIEQYMRSLPYSKKQV